MLKVEEVKALVGRYYKVEMNSRDRRQELVRPRQVAIYLSREYTGSSFAKIGHIMGGRDHSTILSACQRVKKLLEDDEELQFDVFVLRKKLDVRLQIAKSRANLTPEAKFGSFWVDVP